VAEVPVPGRRWGVLGTANIAAKAFLPALRGAGGRAVVVGTRSVERGASWAAANEVARADSYAAVLAAPEVEAVYIALPNDQHAHWAAAAVAAGKVVLCEKPMTLDAAQAEELLSPLDSDAMVWESFVFPFHPQTMLITALLADGRIGELKEVVSEFHFAVGQPGNIRLQPERGGGALYDVGCYPLRLARLLTDREPTAAHGSATLDSVDLDMAAVVDFDGGARLLMSAGMARPASTFTRVVGTAGELRVSNPFHPRPVDSVELWANGERVEMWPAAEGSAFRHAIDHIHQVMAGTAAPRHLATSDALPQARAMDLVRAGAIGGPAHPDNQEGTVPQ